MQKSDWKGPIFIIMITFAEAFVVVTAAGFLLGKKELKAGARFLGIGVGHVVGMLQGFRLKYEEKSRDSDLYNLHKSVKRGLEDMGTIGTDLASISNGNVQAPGRAGMNAVGPSSSSKAEFSESPIPVPQVPILPTARVNTGALAFNNNMEIERLTHLIMVEETTPTRGTALNHQTTPTMRSTAVLSETYFNMINNEKKNE